MVEVTLATTQTPEQLQLRQELRAGETLLWTGRPIPRLAMRSAFAIYFFAIPWTAFSLFWETMALSMFFAAKPEGSDNIPFWFGVIFPLFGLPFVLIGFAMLAAPFYAYRKAQQTIFAITTQRAIMLMSGKWKLVKSYDLKDLGDQIERKEDAQGIGTVYFIFTEERRRDGDVRTKRFGFGPIEHVAQVEAKLRQAIQNARE